MVSVGMEESSGCLSGRDKPCTKRGEKVGRQRHFCTEVRDREMDEGR
jgi:hypothetical protein